MYKIPLSRSISKSTLFDHCKRKYYFQYYTSHLKESAPEIRLEGLMVKNLQSFDMWIGSKIHQLFSDYLNLHQQGEDIEAGKQKILQNIFEEFEQEYQLSAKKNYGKYDKMQKFGLSEHYFQEEIDTQIGKDRIQSQFDNFLESELHTEIVNYFKTAKCFVEEREANFDQMKFSLPHLEEVKDVVIFAQPDFGVKVDDSHFVIYDRKSGRIPEDAPADRISDQLKVYAYKVWLKLGLDKEISFVLKEVFMNDMTILGGEVQSKDLQEVESRILEDVAQQKSLLSDIENNIPKPLEAFAKTDDEGKCARCRFRKICGER